MPVRIERGVQKRVEPKKEQMSSFRLLASIHVEPDWDAKKPDDAGDDWRRPSLQYAAGEVVKSPTDLVAKFGPQKFQRVGAPPKAFQPGQVAKDQLTTTFPEGQVASGHQGTVGIPEGAESTTTPGFQQVSGQASKQGADVDDEGEEATQARSFDTDYGPLDQMTKAELQEVATSEEIELRQDMTKAEMLAELRKAEKSSKR